MDVVDERDTVFFTPDSRTLIICRGDGFRFWDVETLQLTRRLGRDVALYPGHVAFSPDGHLMALEMAPAVIHLKEVSTGRTVAKLEDPDGDRARLDWLLRPTATQLVVAARYAKAIHVWDLRAHPRPLKAMGLDWDWPDSRPRRNPQRIRIDIQPLKIEVICDGSRSRHYRTRKIPRSGLTKARSQLESRGTQLFRPNRRFL